MKSLFATLILFSSPVWAQNAQSTATSQALQQLVSQKGEIVFLQDEHIPARLRDGTPTYSRMVIYHHRQRRLDNDPNLIFPARGHLTCMATYRTSELIGNKLVSTDDVQIKAGAHFAWEPGGGMRPKAYVSYVNHNGFLSEVISLTFYKGPVGSLSCSIARPPEVAQAAPVTVVELIEATQGILSLRTIGN